MSMARMVRTAGSLKPERPSSGVTSPVSMRVVITRRAMRSGRKTSKMKKRKVRAVMIRRRMVEKSMG